MTKKATTPSGSAALSALYVLPATFTSRAEVRDFSDIRSNDGYGLSAVDPARRFDDLVDWWLGIDAHPVTGRGALCAPHHNAEVWPAGSWMRQNEAPT